MRKEIAEYLLLIIAISSLIIIYILYVIYDERKKIKYYETTMSYITNWDKYSNMLKIQKRIIRKKQRKLFFLNILVFLRGLTIWK